ncbi:MAG: anthranilate synthase component I [Fibrobacterota bacterium]|nr:anthranilate synthase component I [Fibrobacterota bacterium]QQS04176.1 MAG: anthranilate synthase component I [Fibrobacterota bacterium]
MIPTTKQLDALSKQGFNMIPVWTERLADTETPVSAYLKLTAESAPEHSFLLESVEGGETVARYSFLGRDPSLVFKSRGEDWNVVSDTTRQGVGEPLTELRRLMAACKVHQPEGLPSLAAAVGFAAYDSIRLVERLPDSCTNDLGMDDLHFGFYDAGVVFDNRRHRILVWSFADMRVDSADLALEKAMQRISQLEAQLDAPLRSTRLDVVSEPSSVTSNFTREDFLAAVGRCKEYIRSGDAFQIVLSQRLTCKPGCSALDIYRMLRGINPSPYMFYLKFGDTEVAGASPELLVRVNDGEVKVRPIAGTRPRGKTPQRDLELEKELLADPKELAEHLMLVDLGRNDVGRVSEYGTVSPKDLFVVERYSHVMHIVSSVTGKLKAGCDALDALISGFPAGTLSGAPKIRAMEIIDELEPTRRGLYGGAVCYLDLAGNLESCIVIRTVVVRDGLAHVQAGAGIVHDSDPAAEFDETLHKASAVVQAIRAAHRAHGELGAIGGSIAEEL